MVKNLVKHSIVFFFVLAGFFFMMIFLLGDALQTKMDNQIRGEVPIQQARYSAWGEVPGYFEFQLKRAIDFYSISDATSSSSQIGMSRQKTIDLDVTRDYVNPNATSPSTKPVWNPPKSTVDYRTKYGYNMPTDDSTSFETLNFGAQSVWYQMTNKPRYWLGWQALNQVTNLMFTNNMIYRFYAYQGYYYMFNDQTLVNTAVLAGLSTDLQTQIYTDADYGMNNADGLLFWFMANGGGKDSADWKMLATKFGLDQDQMTSIVGEKSMIAMIRQNIYETILNDSSLGLSGKFDEEQLCRLQWASGGIVSNPEFYFYGLPVADSVGDPGFDPNYVTKPEYSVYVDANGGTAVEYITPVDVAKLLDQSVESYQSLLNSDNMRAFYSLYELGNNDELMLRFEFSNHTQIPFVYQYIEHIIDAFLSQGSDYKNIALGSLMQKSLNNSYSLIEQTLPLDVSTRALASHIKTAGYDCAHYIDQATTDTTKQQNICKSYDFTNVMSLKLFVNATWYYADPTYMQNLQDGTTLTSAETDKLFDFKTEGTFGADLIAQTTALAGLYSCANATNCTGAEIGGLQWGSAGVTLNPLYKNDDDYLKTASSVKDWWSTEWPAIDQAPEYYSYASSVSGSDATAPALPATAVAVIVSNSTEDLGLNNYYNTGRLVNAFAADDKTKLDIFTKAIGYDAKVFAEVMRYHIQTYTMGGALKTYTAEQLMNGYENDIAAKINGGQYYGGYDFSICNDTTPVFNDMLGSVGEATYGIYTGSNGVDEIAEVRTVNGEAFVNRIQNVWNGTYFTAVPQNPDGDIGMKHAQWLEGSSNGMQFPPFVDTDSTLTVYDSRLVQKMTYKHSGDSSVPDSDVTLSQFSATSFGEDVGFAFNQYFMEKAYGCGGCQPSTDTRKVMVDGTQYVYAKEESDNYIKVQKESGFTYEQKRQATTFIVLGGTETSTPSKVTPFPDLEAYNGMMLPWLDITETMQAGDSKFLEKLNFIGASQTTVRRFTISMSVFAAFFLILGIVAFILYKLKGDDDEEYPSQRDNLIRNHGDD